jgi:hypothetical protein
LLEVFKYFPRVLSNEKSLNMRFSLSPMWWEVSGGGWDIATNVYREGDREVIHRYCEGMVKTWNAEKVSAHEYVATDKVVVILCDAGESMIIDIYRKSRHWEVLRRKISSCDDLRYILPTIRRLLTREGFDATGLMNYIAERWGRLLQRWMQV